MYTHTHTHTQTHAHTTLSLYYLRDHEPSISIGARDRRPPCRSFATRARASDHALHRCGGRCLLRVYVCSSVPIDSPCFQSHSRTRVLCVCARVAFV